MRGDFVQVKCVGKARLLRIVELTTRDLIVPSGECMMNACDSRGELRMECSRASKERTQKMVKENRPDMGVPGGLSSGDSRLDNLVEYSCEW